MNAEFSQSSTLTDIRELLGGNAIFEINVGDPLAGGLASMYRRQPILGSNPAYIMNGKKSLTGDS